MFSGISVILLQFLNELAFKAEFFLLNRLLGILLKIAESYVIL